MLPVILWMAVPVECARRERVVMTGEALTAVFVDAGDGGVVSVLRRGKRSRLGLNIRGNDRRFSSKVEAGDGERGHSSIDMEHVRWLEGRKVALGVKAGIVAWLELSEANSLAATQTPDTSMNFRSASSVSMGSFSVRASANDSESILGAVVGDWVYEGMLGVAVDVADGIE